jgi:hypothetical protein
VAAGVVAAGVAGGLAGWLGWLPARSWKLQATRVVVARKARGKITLRMEPLGSTDVVTKRSMRFGIR